MPRLNWDGNDFRNNRDSSGTVADNISRNGNLQQGYEHGSLTRGLVAYYPMEKGEGEILHDGAFDNTGQIKGANWSENTVFGSHSLQFNGSSDYVETDLIWDKDNLTLAAWVYPRDAGEDIPHDIYDDIDNNSTDWVRLSYRNNSAEIQFDEEGAGGQKVVLEAGEVVNDQWQHLAAVRDVKKGKAVIYVDGEEVGRIDLSSTNTISGLNNAHIGKSSVSDKEYVDGRVKDLRVYNRRLSQPEIEALANLSKISGVEKTEKNVPGLNQSGISRYKLNGNTDDTWSDNNGTDNTGISPSYKTGVYGQAKNFDGVDDEINLEKTTSDLGVNDTGTFSLWVKPENNLGDKNRRFIEDRGNQSGSNFIQAYSNTSNRISLWLNDNYTTHKLQTSSNINLNQWIHVVSTWNASNSTIRLYYNGVTEDKVSSYNGSWSTTDNLIIAGDGGWSGQRHEGLIDDVRIYDKALTPLQVEKLYHKSAYRINRMNTLQ